MKKNNIIFLITLLIFFIFTYSAIANENINFLSLKNDNVNLRQGPSFDHPIKLVYKKKFLPVIILEKSETWRHIKDFKNNYGWIHISQLSKKKAALTMEKDLTVYRKSTIFSKPIAVLEKGKHCLVSICKKDWCKIKVDKYSGWVLKESLWGRL